MSKMNNQSVGNLESSYDVRFEMELGEQDPLR